MSLYDSSELFTDSEGKKLRASSAFEDESVFGDRGELDPNFEYFVDLQNLIAESASAGGEVQQEQLFPDLFGNLGVFPVTDDQHGTSSSSDLGVSVADRLQTDAGFARQVQESQDHGSGSELRPPMPQVALEVPSNVVGITAADCPSPPQVQSADGGCSGSAQQVIADDVGFSAVNSIDLSAAIQAGATLLELPPLLLGSASPQGSEVPDPCTSSGRGGRKTLKATPPSKKRYIEKNSDEYKERRERNNVAVRKSRDKAKQKQTETNLRVKVLSEKNDELQKKVDGLTKELNVLKGLFANIGASLPPEFKKFVIKQER